MHTNLEFRALKIPPPSWCRLKHEFTLARIHHETSGKSNAKYKVDIKNNGKVTNPNPEMTTFHRTATLLD